MKKKKYIFISLIYKKYKKKEKCYEKSNIGNIYDFIWF